MADTVHAAHDDEAANNENRKFAMWLYLTSEVVIFSMLIAGYAVYRVYHDGAVNLVKDSLGILLVTGNTFVLLASSYAMVMGLRAIRMGSRKEFYGWIGLTALLGVVFLGGQYIEYSELGHLGISLDKQDFTVATNIFEETNHVSAEIQDANLYTYNEAYRDEDGEVVANQPIFEQETRTFEIEDLREISFFDSIEEIPLELSNAIVVLPAELVINNETFGAIPNIESRNLTLVQGNVSEYHVDFVTDTNEEITLFDNVDVSTTTIDGSTLFTDYNEDFILLDDAQAPLVDDEASRENEIELALLAINDSVRGLGIRRDGLVPLSRLGVETIGGDVVPFSAILAGQAVDLDPKQYENLNAYFRAVIGDSASDYGMRFYAPTAFHGAHVAIGVIWALIVLWRGYKGYYDKNAIGLEMFGLYWHFVDVVWIVLFTLIYLV